MRIVTRRRVKVRVTVRRGDGSVACQGWEYHRKRDSSANTEGKLKDFNFKTTNEVDGDKNKNMEVKNHLTKDGIEATSVEDDRHLEGWMSGGKIEEKEIKNNCRERRSFEDEDYRRNPVLNGSSSYESSEIETIQDEFEFFEKMFEEEEKENMKNIDQNTNEFDKLLNPTCERGSGGTIRKDNRRVIATNAQLDGDVLVDSSPLRERTKGINREYISETPSCSRTLPLPFKEKAWKRNESPSGVMRFSFSCENLPKESQIHRKWTLDNGSDQKISESAPVKTGKQNINTNDLLKDVNLINNKFNGTLFENDCVFRSDQELPKKNDEIPQCLREIPHKTAETPKSISAIDGNMGIKNKTDSKRNRVAITLSPWGAKGYGDSVDPNETKTIQYERHSFIPDHYPLKRSAEESSSSSGINLGENKVLESEDGTTIRISHRTEMRNATNEKTDDSNFYYKKKFPNFERRMRIRIRTAGEQNYEEIVNNTGSDNDNLPDVANDADKNVVTDQTQKSNVDPSDILNSNNSNKVFSDTFRDNSDESQQTLNKFYQSLLDKNEISTGQHESNHDMINDATATRLSHYDNHSAPIKLTDNSKFTDGVTTDVTEKIPDAGSLLGSTKFSDGVTTDITERITNEDYIDDEDLFETNKNYLENINEETDEDAEEILVRARKNISLEMIAERIVDENLQEIDDVIDPNNSENIEKYGIPDVSPDYSERSHKVRFLDVGQDADRSSEVLRSPKLNTACPTFFFVASSTENDDFKNVLHQRNEIVDKNFNYNELIESKALEIEELSPNPVTKLESMKDECSKDLNYDYVGCILRDLSEVKNLLYKLSSRENLTENDDRQFLKQYSGNQFIHCDNQYSTTPSKAIPDHFDQCNNNASTQDQSGLILDNNLVETRLGTTTERIEKDVVMNLSNKTQYKQKLKHPSDGIRVPYTDSDRNFFPIDSEFRNEVKKVMSSICKEDAYITLSSKESEKIRDSGIQESNSSMNLESTKYSKPDLRDDVDIIYISEYSHDIQKNNKFLNSINNLNEKLRVSENCLFIKNEKQDERENFISSKVAIEEVLGGLRSLGKRTSKETSTGEEVLKPEKTSDRVQTNTKTDTKQISNESDLEEGRIWRDSFAGEDSYDVTSLLSTERSHLLAGNESYSRGRNSDYSFVSDTVSTSEEPQNKASEGGNEELNLTDISAPPSLVSEEETVLGSENDYCEEGSYSTDRDSKAYSDEEGYYVDQYQLDEESQYRLELYNRKRALDEAYKNCLDENTDNPRFYSTIVEESEEEDEADYLEPTLKNLSKKQKMGHFLSRNSGGSAEAEEKVKKRKSKGTEKTDSQHVPSTLSEDWRMSQSSTNTAVSTSTNADSDDTLAENMSELSSVNSHLSYLGGGEHKSLERTKYTLKESAYKKDDPDATPVASPVLPPRKKNAIVKHAIHELENIELAAQNLLQKNQTLSETSKISAEKVSPAPPPVIILVTKKQPSDAQSSLERNEGAPDEDYVEAQEVDSIIAEQEAKFAKDKRKDLTKHQNVSAFRSKIEKPPVLPCNGSHSKNNELKPYISRESYNDDKVLKDVETLRESYKECDLNDFLDKLATSAESGKVDDAIYEQLLADIKADVEKSKRCSTESLQSSVSTASKKDNFESSQESLTPLSRSRTSSAARKFEKFKAKVMQLVRGKKKHKSTKSKLSFKKSQESVNGNNTPIEVEKNVAATTKSSELLTTPTVILTEITEVKNNLSQSADIDYTGRYPDPVILQPKASKTEFSQSSKLSKPDPSPPQSPKPEPSPPEISKPEVKKGFRFANFLKKNSPKSSKKKKKDSKFETGGLDTDTEEMNRKNITDVSLKQTGAVLKGNIKTPNSSPPESKKEVRFKLVDGQAVNSSETTNISEDDAIKNHSETSQKITEKVVIPYTVAELNKQLNGQKDAQSIDDNLLNKLPERIKPPRRKKKNLVPVTVEGMKVENIDGSSIISSDSDVRISCEISEEIKVAASTKMEYPKRSQDQIKYPSEKISSVTEIKTQNGVCTVMVHQNEDGPSLFEGSNKFETIVVSTAPSKIDAISITNKSKADTKETLITEKVDMNANSTQIVEKVTPSASDEGALNDQSTFEKDSTPKFPDVTDIQTSFYDNVNPFYEIMTKVVEEADVVESSKRNSLTKLAPTMERIVEKDEASHESKKEPTFSTSEIHIKNTLDLADVIQNIIDNNMTECDFPSSEELKFNNVKQNEFAGKVADKKIPALLDEVERIDIIHEINDPSTSDVKVFPQEACKSPVMENKDNSSSVHTSKVIGDCQAVENKDIFSSVKESKELIEDNEFIEPLLGSKDVIVLSNKNMTHNEIITTTQNKCDGLNSSFIDSSTTLINYKELEKQNTEQTECSNAFSMEELNSLTAEIARITDDMEKEINFAKEKITFIPSDAKNGTVAPKPLERKHKVDIQTGKVYNLFDSTNNNLTAQPDLLPSTFHKKRMLEAFSQTDTEYDETDFETESEIDDWAKVQKRKGHSRRFFGPSPLYTKCDESSANEDELPRKKLAPAVPPRHFQQIMPTRVVDELKLVLSDNEEVRLRKPTEQPPRWDSDLSYEHGRCNSNMSGAADSCETQVVSSDARVEPSAWQQPSVSSADSPFKQPLSLSLFSNPLTAQNNLIATAVVKHTKTDRNGRLDRRSSYSVSTENLAPILEEGGHAADKKNSPLNVASIEDAKSVIKGTMSMINPYHPQASKNSFRLRAKVYPAFAPAPMIPTGKPPVPRPHAKKNTNLSPSYEEGYLSDPGTHKFIISKNNPNLVQSYRKSSGYVTDSEILTHRARSHPNIIYDSNLKLDAIKPVVESTNEGTDDLTNCEIPPPRPPPPSAEDLVKLDKPLFIDKEQGINREEESLQLKEKLTAKESSLNALQPSNESKINFLSSKVDAKPISDSSDLSLLKVSPTIENAHVYPINRETTSEQALQSTILSFCKPRMQKLKEENKEDAAQSGTEPKTELSYLQRRETKNELSYLQRRARPYTWCAPSTLSLSTVSDINKVKSETEFDYSEKLFNQDSVRDDNVESRASSQLSHYSNKRRISVQGLGEWLFLARLDHTNDLLNQLTSTMHLQSDCSIDSRKEQQDDLNDISEKNKPNKSKSPEPPPRPRTPIDERDPEQVHAEQRYLAYFQGPPRAKHPPSENDPLQSPPTFQQIEAQKRYENYFSGPPRARTPAKTPSPPPEDEETLKAKNRYLSNFQKGPPRPRPKSNIETERNLEDDEEMLEAKRRYLSYFNSGPQLPPRSRSAVSQERTPEPDEEQKAAERRYMSYFNPGPPRPRSVSVDKDRIQEPDEEQIAAEKRYLKYFNGLPKAKHEKKNDEEKRIEITTEMVQAEERFLKYFGPVPCGGPKRLKPPPPPGEEEEKKIQLLKEFQTALESRINRKEMKIVKVSKPKKEVERESTPPTLRDIVVEEFLQKVQDRKKEKDLHFGDTDDEDDFADLTKEIEKKDYSQEPIIQGGGTIDKRIASDLQLFISQEGECQRWIACHPLIMCYPMPYSLMG